MESLRLDSILLVVIILYQSVIKQDLIVTIFCKFYLCIFLGNVAYMRSNTTHSFFNDSSTSYYSVDGVQGVVLSQCSNALALPGEAAWWSVDLSSQHVIRSIIIYNGDLKSIFLNVAPSTERVI